MSVGENMTCFSKNGKLSTRTFPVVLHLVLIRCVQNEMQDFSLNNFFLDNIDSREFLFHE